MRAAVSFAVHADTQSAVRKEYLMCGRYAFDDSKEIFEARKIIEELADNIGEKPRVKTGDIYPSETAAVLAQTQDGYCAAAMAWGYPMHGSSRQIINARCETVCEKPLFAGSLQNRRCLVPCTGFYEWKTIENRKQKYLIRPYGTTFFYLAGLYRLYHKNGGKTARFVILTAPASSQMQDIHSRMPLIIPKESADAWFAPVSDNLTLMRHMYKMTDALDITAV